MQGFNQYDPLIPVCGGSCISWSYVIRAIEAQQILLQAAFFDENGLLIDTRQVDITCGVSCQFSRQEAQFIAPCSACLLYTSPHLDFTPRRRNIITPREPDIRNSLLVIFFDFRHAFRPFDEQHGVMLRIFFKADV